MQCAVNMRRGFGSSNKSQVREKPNNRPTPYALKVMQVSSLRGNAFCWIFLLLIGIAQQSEISPTLASQLQQFQRFLTTKFYGMFFRPVMCVCVCVWEREREREREREEFEQIYNMYVISTGQQEAPISNEVSIIQRYEPNLSLIQFCLLYITDCNDIP